MREKIQHTQKHTHMHTHTHTNTHTHFTDIRKGIVTSITEKGEGTHRNELNNIERGNGYWSQ